MISLKWLSSKRDPRSEVRDLGLFGITDVPLRLTMSDTCVSVLCVCLYLHVSSVNVCVHVFVGVVCVHVCV